MHHRHYANDDDAPDPALGSCSRAQDAREALLFWRGLLWGVAVSVPVALLLAWLAGWAWRVIGGW